MVCSTVPHAWPPPPRTDHPIPPSFPMETGPRKPFSSSNPCLHPPQRGSTAPPDSPFLTGKVDSQQDTLLRVLAPAAVHHHHVPDPLRPGALQAHGLDRQRRSHSPAFPDGGPFHHQINIKDFCFLPFPLGVPELR